MSTPREATNVAVGGTAVLPDDAAVTAVGKHVLIVGQLALAAWVVQMYAIEGPTFMRLFLLAVAGFVVNLAVPREWRLPFFSSLSLAGAFVVFGATDAAWLIASGFVLIGLCHLPFSLRVRTGIILAAAAALAIARSGLVAAPWSAAVWPILGSMFMFRLALYLLTSKQGRPEGGFWSSVAYFFMLPNLTFPLFPVVDYQTFRRNYYDRSDTSIYEQGVLWIVRGLLHLLLYRFVYQLVLNDPVDVVRLSDLVRYMVGTFLLYLRVSGQFHLIVGLLHLFGFRLPETHKLYYLAHSFTELWRRINIYWTDFMMKTVFYPTYFRVKKLGPVRSMVVATTAVFVTTWVLHSYQWFWLRGGFPLTAQDTLFWGILGALVVAGAVKELRAGKKPRQRAAGWNWRMGLRAAITFSLFCFLWSLWSTESVAQWVWMLSAAANIDAIGVLMLTGVVGLVFALGGRDWEAAPAGGPRWLALAAQPAVRASTTLLVLLVIGQPAVQSAAPEMVAAGLGTLKTTGLNERDAALQARGYYEQLDVRAQLNAEVLDVTGPREDWANLAATGMIRERTDTMTRDLWPSRSVMWNGRRFTTNRWGMRDQDYIRTKAPGTLRIALLGPSHVMGNNVADGEAFESVLERRLNRQLPRGYDRVEILNFGVDGYGPPQQLALLEDRVLDFTPDIVIATHHQRSRTQTEGYIRRLAEGDIVVPDDQFQLLARAGLTEVPRGRVAIPFVPLRRLAARLGIDTRMPEGEIAARARRIADDMLALSFRRFGEVTRANGAVPMVLALNAVFEDELTVVPYRELFDTLDLPLLDLFGIYPPERRAALRVAPWDDHPNAAGHQLIADRMYEQLAEFLDSHHWRTAHPSQQSARQ